MQDLTELQTDIEAWRRAHGGRRGPLPIELRRRAGVLAGWLGEDPVAEALDLDPRSLERWFERYASDGADAAQPQRGRATASFVDIGHQVAAALTTGGQRSSAGPDGTIEVTVVKPSGTRVSVRGAFEPAALREVLTMALGVEA